MSSWRVHSGSAFRASKYWESPVGFPVHGVRLDAEDGTESALSPAANGGGIGLDDSEVPSAVALGVVGPVFAFLDRNPSREMILSPTFTSLGPTPRFLFFGMLLLRFCDMVPAQNPEKKNCNPRSESKTQNTAAQVWARFDRCINPDSYIPTPIVKGSTRYQLDIPSHL